MLVSDLVEFCANNAHRVALQSAEEIVEDDTSRPLLDVKYSEVKNVFHELIVKVVIENMQSMAQSDPNFQRRMASLYFFNELFKAVHNFNSFVPPTETRDPFVSASVLPLADYEQEKRERTIRILIGWITSVNACVASNLSDTSSNSALATQAILSANSLFKLAMRCVSDCIMASEDQSATNLFTPLLNLTLTIQSLLLNISNHETNDNLRSAAIKFTETVILRFSRKDQTGRKSGNANDQDFNLEDVPDGHPSITRASLEDIGNSCFNCLRGWCRTGGQISVISDDNIVADLYEFTFVKQADVTFRLAEQEDPTFSTATFMWRLQVKSYSLAMNALAIVGATRSAFFKPAAETIVALINSPPSETPTGLTSRAATNQIYSAIKATGLKMLRNHLSIVSKTADALKNALSDESVGMMAQAAKAKGVAESTIKLLRGGRKARQLANLAYEWEAADTGAKRKADDDLANMRASKIARGLGNGIQLPVSMSDSVDLILLNLENSLPPNSDKADKPSDNVRDLQFLVDAVQSGGKSLEKDKSRWYANAGGISWDLIVGDDGEISMDIIEEVPSSSKTLFAEQCEMAAADAFGRIVASGRVKKIKEGLTNFDFTEAGKNNLKRHAPTAANSAPVGSLGGSVGGVWSDQLIGLRDTIASRLAWTLKCKPRGELAMGAILVEKSAEGLEGKEEGGGLGRAEKIKKLKEKFPLVPACLTKDFLDPPPVGRGGNSVAMGGAAPSLASRTLFEGYVQDEEESKMYNEAMDTMSNAAAHICNVVSLKLVKGDQTLLLPMEHERRKAAKDAISNLAKTVAVIPKLTEGCVSSLAEISDIREAVNFGVAVSLKERSQNNAATSAAEKRARLALIAFRDTLLHRTDDETARMCIETAVGVASGRIPSVDKVADDALRLVVNKNFKLFPKNQALLDQVLESSKIDLQLTVKYVNENSKKVEEGNKEKMLGMEKEDIRNLNPNAPLCDLEKEVFGRCRRSVNLFLALCKENSLDLFNVLMKACSGEESAVLAKAFKAQLPVFVMGAAKKHGEAVIAEAVAKGCGVAETPLLLALLDNLSPRNINEICPETFVEACLNIQKSRLRDDGSVDPRYAIPVVSSLEREKLVEMLPLLMKEGEDTLKAALFRMRERLGRSYNQFREGEGLKGMTTCEQLVFMHDLDLDMLKGLGLKQTHYLKSIMAMMLDKENFTDRVAMSALDYMVMRAINLHPVEKQVGKNVEHSDDLIILHRAPEIFPIRSNANPSNSYTTHLYPPPPNRSSPWPSCAQPSTA